MGVAGFQRRLHRSGYAGNDRFGCAQRSVSELNRSESETHMRRRKRVQRRARFEQFGAPLIIGAFVNLGREMARGERQAKSTGEKLGRIISGQCEAELRPRW